ncbi:MAG: hypothetical protein ACI9A7_000300 [Cyclobacteriaceae bacterium]|jgi:hypothetical protein
MNTRINNLLAPTAAAASLLMLGSCGDDEETPATTDFLIGEWEVVSVDGEVSGEVSDTSSYALLFSFEANGDFKWCYDYENKITPAESYEECYNGDWRWVTQGELLEISYTDTYTEDGIEITETEEVDLKVTKLTATELEGEWQVEGEGESAAYDVIFKKN